MPITSTTALSDTITDPSADPYAHYLEKAKHAKSMLQDAQVYVRAARDAFVQRVEDIYNVDLMQMTPEDKQKLKSELKETYQDYLNSLIYIQRHITATKEDFHRSVRHIEHNQIGQVIKGENQ